MPATNNQLVRYLILDKFFRDPHGHYRFWDLYNALNDELHARGLREIKDRSLHEDIAIMQSEDKGFGVKLKHWFEGKERIYQYEDLDFSILNMPLTRAQRDQLGRTIQMLSQIKGLPNFKWLEQTLVLLREEFQLDNAGAGRGASIYYTLDGSTPTAETGTVYSGPVTLTETTTVKAVAVKDGVTSSVTSRTYTKGSNAGGGGNDDEGNGDID